MEGYIYLGIIVLIGIFFAIQSYRSKKQGREKLAAIIDKNYGNIQDRKYKREELERISQYYKHLKKSGKVKEEIDDITWNDLDMDSVFMQINNTYSSIGEDYLYSMLKTPKSKAVLNDLDATISYFYQNENEAKNLQKSFSSLGRTRVSSLIEFIHNLGNIKKKSNLIHYVCIVAFFASVICLLTKPAIGIVAFIAVLAYNVVSYYRKKADIENYFASFRYLVNTISLSKIIGKAIPKDLKAYVDEINSINGKLSSLQKGMFLISDSIDGSIIEIVMDYIRMIFHVDIIKFNSLLRKTVENMDQIDKLFDSLGELEACIAIASYRKYLAKTYEEFSKPCFVDKERYISFENIYHPLISSPVKNSLTEEKGVLLTGSNASGKSTFLKTVAINCILARTIYTVTAHSMNLSMFRVYSSMSLKDDLENHDSYYMVEIKALKRIIDASKDTSPMVCFVDEVLRGTNTVERIAASSQILKSLNTDNVLCFAATHDIELTHILEASYSNYHFEESVVNDDVCFNYQLLFGRATTRNAILLLKVIGYSDNIIEAAKKRADDFMTTGRW